jgi:hypothetical protein
MGSYNAPMRYRLRTLLIVLAIGPPLLAGAWLAIARYRAWQTLEVWEDVGGPGIIAPFEGRICDGLIVTDDDSTIQPEPPPDNSN